MPSSTIDSKQNVSDPEHKKYYFDKVQVESFLRQLKHDRFVLITAEKGAGVSTFMRYIAATIQDKVRSEASDKMSDHWKTINVRPGLSPQKSLLRELARIDFSDAKKAINFEEEAEQILNSSNSLGLVNLFNSYPIREHEKLLIIIDPLDDLFLFENTYQGEEIKRFVNLLYTFPQHSSLPVYFAITFANNNAKRSIHYGKLLDLLYKYKFSFSGPSIEDIPKMVTLFFQNLPAELQQVQDLIADQLREGLLKYKNEHSWKYLLQLILKQFYAEYQKLPNEGKDKPKTKETAETFWRAFYKNIGGVDNLINVQAEKIRTNLDKDDQLLCLLMFRTQINKQGEFEPIDLKTMIEILEGAISFSTDYQSRVEFIIKTFTIDLEILELIHPMEISDRGISLGKEFKVSPGTVIMLRNNFFKTKWEFFNTCIEEKVKLVLDYEWYCRMAKQEPIEHSASLQPYAMKVLTNPEIENIPEFSSIYIITKLTPEWIIRNIGTSPSDIEDLDRTKRFIQDEVAHWQKVAADETKERKRLAKRRERFILIGFGSMLFLTIFYLTVTQIQSDLQEDYDLAMQKNLAIRITVDNIFVSHIRAVNISIAIKSEPIFYKTRDLVANGPFSESSPRPTKEQIDTLFSELWKPLQNIQTTPDSFLAIKKSLHYDPDAFQIENKFFLNFLFDFRAKKNQHDSIIAMQTKGNYAIHRAIDQFGTPNDFIDSIKIKSGKDKNSIIRELNSKIKKQVLENGEIAPAEYDEFNAKFKPELLPDSIKNSW